MGVFEVLVGVGEFFVGGLSGGVDEYGEYV